MPFPRPQYRRLGYPYGGSDAWADYISSLAPVRWFRFRETSGLAAANLGSVSGNANYKQGVVLGQTGKLGANDAVLFDGVNDYVEDPYNAGWSDLTLFEWAILYKPTGSSGNSRVLGPSTGGILIILRTAPNTPIRVLMVKAEGGSATTETVGYPVNNWYLLNVNYDDAGTRIPRIYVNGVEAAYTLQAALTGTYKKNPAGTTFGANELGSSAMPGYIDEVMLFNYKLTDAQRLKMKTLAGL